MSSTKKHVLVVELGFRIYKEPIIKSLFRNKEYQITIATGIHDRTQYGWAEKYTNQWIFFDYSKSGDLLIKIREFQTQHEVIFSGILTYVDPTVCIVNELQHSLELPIISEKTGRLLKNKAKMREIFSKNNVTQPKFWIIKSKKDLVKFKEIAPKSGFVLKPTELMSGVGVVKFSDPSQLDMWYEKIKYADFWDEDLRSIFTEMGTEVLAEELVEGPLYSVETIVCNGKLQIIGITAKASQDKKSIFFDELGHIFPAKIPTDLYNKISDLISRSHSALTLRNTVTHTEIKVHNNIPYLIELNPRLGGDLISYLIEKSSGINIGKILLDTSCGIPSIPILKVKKQHVISFCTTEQEGLVSKIVKHSLLGIPNIRLLIKVGDIIWRDGLIGKTRIAFQLGDRKFISKSTMSKIENSYQIEPLVGVFKHEDNQLFIFKTGDALKKTLFEIEKKSWGVLAAKLDTISNRLKRKQNIFLSAYCRQSNRIVGFLTATLIQNYKFNENIKWLEMSKYSLKSSIKGREQQSSACHYGLSISVPDDSPYGTAIILLKALLAYSIKENIYQVAYGARLSNFIKYKNSGMDIYEYYENLLAGTVKEPSVTMGLKNGGKIICLVPEYFNDPDSSNFGVLIHFDLRNKHD